MGSFSLMVAFTLFFFVHALAADIERCINSDEVCLLQLKQGAASSSTRWTSLEGDDLEPASAALALQNATGSSATLISLKDAAIFAEQQGRSYFHNGGKQNCPSACTANNGCMKHHWHDEGQRQEMFGFPPGSLIQPKNSPSGHRVCQNWCFQLTFPGKHFFCISDDGKNGCKKSCHPERLTDCS